MYTGNGASSGCPLAVLHWRYDVLTMPQRGAVTGAAGLSGMPDGLSTTAEKPAAAGAPRAGTIHKTPESNEAATRALTRTRGDVIDPAMLRRAALALYSVLVSLS